MVSTCMPGRGAIGSACLEGLKGAHVDWEVVEVVEQEGLEVVQLSERRVAEDALDDHVIRERERRLERRLRRGELLACKVVEDDKPSSTHIEVNHALLAVGIAHRRRG